jgi:monoterpene epsilon-lactone hydrolase
MPSLTPLPSLFSRVPFLVGVASTVARTLARRASEGRPHAEWTLPYHVAMSALRKAAHEYPELSQQLARSSTAPLPLSLRYKVRIAEETLAGLPAEVHVPRGYRAGGPTFLYLHGGGYVTCSPRTHRDVIARLAIASGARCIAPDYRLAPAHPFPAALDDALACYRSLIAAGQAPESLFVGGDSAGGGLTLALVQRLRDLRLPLPRALVLLSPWVDLSLPYESLAPWGDHDYLAAQATVANALEYAGAESLKHPLISPSYADLRGLPSMFVQTGEWELLREQNIDFVRRAQVAGVDVEHSLHPGMLHAFTCFAGLTSQGEQAIASLGRYLREQLEPRTEELSARAS